SLLALNHFKKMMEIRPDDAEGYYYYGNLQIGDNKAKYWLEAITRNPRYWPAHLNLVSYYQQAQDDAKTAVHITQLLRWNQDILKACDEDLKQNLIKVYRDLGKKGFKLPDMPGIDG
ncbi:hypothetical protein ACFL54_03825, partial [Planctomycetota bacterium]